LLKIDKIKKKEKIGNQKNKINKTYNENKHIHSINE
jgi:hypothetical protein